jgi:Tfp pilus assembly protein PilE
MAFVVAILSVLSAAAVARYQHHVYRSKRTEAFYGLRTIHDLQMEHFQRTQQYTDSFQDLGAPLSGGQILEDGSFKGDVYTFTLETWDRNGQPNANYRATATGDLDPSDNTLDIVIIENDLKVIE